VSGGFCGNSDCLRSGRWQVEVAFFKAKQIFGAGQAHNRTAAAVERTLPFMLIAQSVTICWYAQHGHDPADTTDHRARRPWYTTKTQPSTADMIAKLRRLIIAAKFRPEHPDQPQPHEIQAVLQAWEDTTA
jgi:hypothetical protein